MSAAVAKAGLAGLVVVAGGSVGTWYLVTNKLVSVADDGQTYEDSTIGKKYGAYFLSSKYNQRQWNNIFEQYKTHFSPQTPASTDSSSTKAKDKFGSVDKAYGRDSAKDPKALNQVCDAAYKLKASSNLVDDEKSATDKFLKRNIWKYCALGDIEAVEEDNTNYSSPEGTDSPIWNDTNNKKIFVSTKAAENNWFWEIRNQEFWGNGDRSKSKSKGPDEQNKDNVFKKAASGKHIKDICEEAYKKNSSSDNGNKNKEDAELFCSIKLDISGS